MVMTDNNSNIISGLQQQPLLTTKIELLFSQLVIAQILGYRTKYSILSVCSSDKDLVHKGGKTRKISKNLLLEKAINFSH